MRRALFRAIFKPLKQCIQCFALRKKPQARHWNLQGLSGRISSASKPIAALLCLATVAFVSSLPKYHDHKSSCPVTDKAARRRVAPHKAGSYLVVRLSASLGDSLFRYATAVSLARKHGKKLGLERQSPNPLSETFDLRWLKRMDGNCLDKINEMSPEHLEEAFGNFSGVNVALNGDFQSLKHLNGSHDVIREELKFTRSMVEHAKEIIRDRVGYKYGQVPLIGIHVVTKKLLNQSSVGHYDVQMGSVTSEIIPSDTSIFPSLRYVMHAMDYMRLKFGQVLFLVMCEDPAWCERRMKFADTVTFRGQPQSIQLAILSLVNANILTTGSLGWWGAWLGGGHTVYPRDYPWQQLHIDGKNLSSGDYFMPSWKPV